MPLPTVESLLPRIATIKSTLFLSVLVCDVTLFNRAIHPYTLFTIHHLACLTLLHHGLLICLSMKWPKAVVSRTGTYSVWAIFLSWVAVACLFIAAVGRGVCMLDLDDERVRLFGMVLRPTEVPVQLLIGLFSLIAQLYLLAAICRECYDVRELLQGSGEVVPDDDEEVLLPCKTTSEKMG
ncbi:uncharacterized protein LACBIDRAFT_317168 [Laccaria bicolor S238N-H82]|uniref:Predicted protein n=1 Tax=Laccaria bicolor (strain S238N-H82 / ATCC MYA-4686) TaxID=486041 RepID=B0D4J4_LACBS|nr:uncharacterized protein LACBIDRAFT_317168 [Laccaria bicolor S238N-H82]EDR10575.1 predicted protein [Laccaria bicolor S238N-H82]|eukprot:XP_001879025.1 predicted protein [Laccaria bicolor S238N-H82]